MVRLLTDLVAAEDRLMELAELEEMRKAVKMYDEAIDKVAPKAVK